MKPRASASFCHWPKLTSTPCRPRLTQLRVEPERQPCDHIFGARPSDGGGDGRPIVEAGEVADADGVSGAEFEAEEILERAGEARAPLRGARCD